MTVEELENLKTDPVLSELEKLAHRAHDLEVKLGHTRTMSFFNLASGETRAIGNEMENWLQLAAYSRATEER
jgi:hypothetical protein